MAVDDQSSIHLSSGTVHLTSPTLTPSLTHHWHTWSSSIWTSYFQSPFLKLILRLWWLVEGCLGGASNRTNLRVHFTHRHAQDTIVILEEGNLPYPRCPKCNMFVFRTSPSMDSTLWRTFSHRGRKGSGVAWRRRRHRWGQRQRSQPMGFPSPHSTPSIIFGVFSRRRITTG